MSNPLLEPSGSNPLLRPRSNPLLGGSNPLTDSGFNAPIITPRGLTSPVDQNLTSTTPALSDLQLGRALQILDAVRERRTKWQDAKSILDLLPVEDKKTLVATRGQMTEDERRALGMSKGGDGIDWGGLIGGGPSLLDVAGLDNVVGDTISNLAGDVTTLVKNTIPGLAKTGAAIGGDIARDIRQPGQGFSLLNAVQGDLPKSAVMEEIVNPTIEQYKHTYGPLFRGNPMETASRIQEHPLGPLLDVFAVASMGLGTAGRIAATKAVVEATKVVPEGENTFRMGVVDRTNETYQPLGYNMEYYVRPTTQQIKNEPWTSSSSFLLNARTGETLFSPVGSSHDEIFDALGRGTARAKDWEGPDIVGGRIIFDPRTGKVGAANIIPEQIPLAHINKMDELLDGVRSQADETYITKTQLKGMSKANQEGSIVIKQNPGGRRDPTTGEELPPTWYVSVAGQRIQANLPDYDSAVGYAQSLMLGGVAKPVLEREWQHFITPEGELGRERVAVGERVTRVRPALASRLSRSEEAVQPFQARGAAQIGAEAFLQRPRGSLIDAYESARQITHQTEFEKILSEVVENVLDDPAMANRESIMTRLREEFAKAGENLTMTQAKDVGKFRGRVSEQGEFISPSSSAALSALGITAREVSDLVRAGAIFLRPAYIPNNWAGNAFLNVIHQGVFAPVNLAKALVMDKHLGTLNTRAIDQSMGYNAANIMSLSEKGSGYVAAATDPVAKLMGSIADQPFRRSAWIHEARRSGYKTLGQMRQLLEQANKELDAFKQRHAEVEVDGEMAKQQWDPKTTPALHEIGKIARGAQEEIIKFGKYNEIERSVLRNLIFVYSWMRGSGRYFGRFPMQHPIQAAAFMNFANVGQNWLNQEMGGVPSFLIGAIPVGKDEKGNSILINPFSVNPLGSGQELFSAGGSLVEMLTNPDEFNKYTQTDPVGLLNPLIQNAVESYTGGRPFADATLDTIAALRLKENLEHPGRGQVYPTSRTEALGQFVVGSMFPRESSQAAITRALQREQRDQPEQRIDDEVAYFKKTTGRDLPPEFIESYRQDLEKLEQQRDFQKKYAKDHGRQGFTNMPAANRAEAAITYLEKRHLITAEDVAALKESLKGITDDATMNEYANALWRKTGAGAVKDAWDRYVRGAAAETTLTPARP